MREREGMWEAQRSTCFLCLQRPKRHKSTFFWSISAKYFSLRRPSFCRLLSADAPRNHCLSLSFSLSLAHSCSFSRVSMWVEIPTECLLFAVHDLHYTSLNFHSPCLYENWILRNGNLCTLTYIWSRSQFVSFRVHISEQGVLISCVFLSPHFFSLLERERDGERERKRECWKFVLRKTQDLTRGMWTKKETNFNFSLS